jgi:hypothetical protein
VIKHCVYTVASSGLQADMTLMHAPSHPLSSPSHPPAQDSFQPRPARFLSTAPTINAPASDGTLSSPAWSELTLQEETQPVSQLSTMHAITHFLVQKTPPVRIQLCQQPALRCRTTTNSFSIVNDPSKPWPVLFIHPLSPASPPLNTDSCISGSGFTNIS